MQMTPEQQKKDEAAYAAAFDEDMAPAREQTDDEAFGLAEPAAEQAAEPAPAAQAAEPPAAPVADDSAAAGEPAGQTAVEEAGEAPDADESASSAAPDSVGEEGAEAPVAEIDIAAPASDIEKERQRLKSWEGRLKKIQAELDAKGATVEPAATEALEEVGEQAEQQGDEALGDAATQAADKVEDGSMTAEQAMKQLAEDFGEDFVRMIEVIASAKAKEAGASAAGEKVGELGKSINEIVDHISDREARAHFKQIADAHPDFQDIGKSEGFAAYVNGLPNADGAKRIVTSGSADEINKLLSDYKASQKGDSPEELAAADEPAANPVVDEATSAQMDDAEGVRSTGMKLPETPAAASGSYEDAWNEFA